MPYLWLILPLIAFTFFAILLSSDGGPVIGPSILLALLVAVLECTVSGIISLAIPQISTHVHRVAVIEHQLISPPAREVDRYGHRSFHFYYRAGGLIRDEEAEGDVTLYPGSKTPSVVVTSTTEGETDCRDAPGWVYRALRHMVFWDPDPDCALSLNRVQTVKRYDLYL